MLNQEPEELLISTSKIIFDLYKMFTYRFFISSFYLMTMRYNCKGPITHTFNGYDDGLLKQLNPNLKAQFPAVLTHRSGLSNNLVKLMRPAFQHGIGSHRFAKMLRIIHIERYDELQLQYYLALDDYCHSIVSFFQSSEKKCSEFPAYNDKKTYNGFSPSANYISYVYSSIIAKIRPFMDQLISMLDGIILKGDHSFKIIDHMAKVNGVSTFSCLYTMLNEYEEIRLMVLSHSKKMENLSPQFNEMMNTYQRLGMNAPELFYTDNVIGDQAFLKEVIPSLCKDVVEVAPKNRALLKGQEQFHLLPKVTLPSDTTIIVISEVNEIDTACQVIIDDSERSDNVYLGFDYEWVGSSFISLIQISYKNIVYLFRVHSFTSLTFPKNLSEVIRSEKILKIGRNIQNDFTRLNRAFELDIPSTNGKLDVGAFCYDRGVISRSRSRLDQICAYVLKLYLSKTPSLRCGNWEAPILSEEQKYYAAIDAWIGLEIFERTKMLPLVNQSVNDSTSLGTFVAIYSKTSKQHMPSGFGYLVEKAEAQVMDNNNNLVKRIQCNT